MHDHLRDLGREMALELSHPPRLWRLQDLKRLESKGFRSILAQAEGRCFHSIFDETMGCGVTYFLEDTSLLWLQLEYLGLPQPDLNPELNSIPQWIPLQNLHCLMINNGYFQKLWQRDVQTPLKLRELRFSLCSTVQRFPVYIGRLQHLKKIILDFGFPGSSLPEGLCALQSLEILELSCCPKLSSLPPRLGDLRKLRYLDLSNCEQLEELPHSFNQLKRLEFIRLSCCWKLKLRLDMLENITMLEYFDLTRCHEVEELPDQITNQARLTRLFVEGTSIKDLPTNIGDLCSLEELRIGSQMLTSLPASLGKLSCLNSLLLDGCPQLEYLPPSVSLDLPKQVEIRASGLRELPFGAASSNFEVTGKQASNSVYNLRPSITEHGSLQTLSPDKLHARLGTLSLVANPQLLEIRMLPQSLKILEICVCKVLRNMSGIRSLVKLLRLEICDCPVLDDLPSFADLASLQEFKIQGCPKVERIEGLEHCKSLRFLTAEVPLILTCDTISALKPCISSMKGLQKCPWEMMIRGSVINFVLPIAVDSLSVVNLTVFWLEEDSDWNNITQDLFNRAWLWYEEENESNDMESGSSVNTSVRKVVHIAVCTEGCSAFSEYCGGRRNGSNPNVKQRKAMLATGTDERVVAAFDELLELLE